MCEQGEGKRERERERISLLRADSPLSAELDMGLDFTAPRP